MLPAAALLLVFLTYPLGLGAWLGFTDTTIGRPGRFVGLANFVSLVPRLGLLALGLEHLRLHGGGERAEVRASASGSRCSSTGTSRSSRFVRAIMLLPFIVPTVLSAIAFWWIYDSQFSIISWTLLRLGLIDHFIDFLGDPV